MLKFGKKSSDILEVKKSFITENKNLYRWQKKLYKIYSNQPKRKYCKNCEKKLKGERFEKLNIEYIICDNCKHVNGIYQDTKLLSKKFYQTDAAKSYSKIYLEKALKLKPNYPEAQNNLGNVYKQLREYDQAFIHYQKVIKSDSNQFQAYNNLGVILQKKAETPIPKNIIISIPGLDHLSAILPAGIENKPIMIEAGNNNSKTSS